MTFSGDHSALWSQLLNLISHATKKFAMRFSSWSHDIKVFRNCSALEIGDNPTILWLR